MSLSSPTAAMTNALSTTMGALLVASWFATGLSGVVFYQAYVYYRTRPAHDHWAFSALVRATYMFHP